MTTVNTPTTPTAATQGPTPNELHGSAILALELALEALQSDTPDWLAASNSAQAASHLLWLLNVKEVGGAL